MASMKGIFEDIKGAIKSLNRRRAENTMAKKKTKRTNNDLQNTTQKLQTEKPGDKS
jgi:hypothetical protein